MSKDTTEKLKRLSTLWNWIDNSESKIYMRPEEGGYFCIKDWADKFAVSPRTIMRDLALIKEMGIQFYYTQGKNASLLSSEWNFSLEDLHLTPQMAAVLCVAYQEAKSAGKAFEGVCREIKNKFIPQIEHCEINPPLPVSALTQTLQKAIRRRYYVKIKNSSGTEKYIKPYCFIRIAKRRTDLIYLETKTTPVSATIEKTDNFRAISLKSIKNARISAPNCRARSAHFPQVRHQKWAAFAFIRWHTESVLQKNK